jgi:hypothetical protein
MPEAIRIQWLEVRGWRFEAENQNVPASSLQPPTSNLEPTRGGHALSFEPYDRRLE